VVLPGGVTVGEHARAGIEAAYQTGQVPDLLPRAIERSHRG
jgi:hypothetical protein